MHNIILRSMVFLVISLGLGCATVPIESVSASRQLEENLETLRQNNLLLLNAWYNLSVDYWTDKVGREGPDKILAAAKKNGSSIDLTKDYGELVQKVLEEYRKNFLATLNTSYQTYHDAINEDYAITINGVQKLTNLLQSIVKVNAERTALIESIRSELQVRDGITKVQSQLQSPSGP